MYSLTRCIVKRTPRTVLAMHCAICTGIYGTYRSMSQCFVCVCIVTAQLTNYIAKMNIILHHNARYCIIECIMIYHTVQIVLADRTLTLNSSKST